MTALLQIAKDHLNVTGTDDDVMLERIIKDAVDFVERYTGNVNDIVPFASGEITFGPSLMSPGETITLGGELFTAYDAGAPIDPRHFLIGDTPEKTAGFLADAWGVYFASLAEWPGWFPSITVDGRVARVQASDDSPGALAFTMATNSPNVTLSGPTLTADVSAKPGVLRATLLLIGHLYANREASLVGVSAEEVPFGFWDLLAPYRSYSF